MKTSESFLKRYVPDLDVRGKDFAEKITMTGTKIETYEALDKNLSNIKVGKILKIEKHPNADKLVVCQIDIGDRTIQICTAAKNCYEGMMVPVVLDGGKVANSNHDSYDHPDGLVIKNGKLRGVDSMGMMCGIEELGKLRDIYGGDEGIYDLKDFDCKPGDDAIDCLLFRDYAYDFEITSNRVDCYSTIGIAREVAATFSKKFVYPNEKYNATASEKDYVKVDIVDKDLCKCFSTRLIKNVKIGESPMWMKDALRKVGIRPINNIVDITNFVMMEYGQPLHAYDYKTIRDKKIIVKRADKGEKFVTLDGKEHILDDTVLTIRDGGGTIGIAGIMGGANSMITDSATEVLFEGACFDGTNIRLSSKKLGMRTEASNLFEKGLDPNNAIKAVDRCCALVEELSIGE
ncbi:MAG: phenylalanine--tRNA ligase subunit beta, partial [Lachnospiraceae bacterium]|nr:phenylalanine--tRNA ligase subunit beta [Lachnospiraceae bacterium]